jgi:hypothetical protein
MRGIFAAMALAHVGVATTACAAVILPIGTEGCGEPGRACGVAFVDGPSAAMLAHIT